jgi:hypothetical protein
MASRFLTAAALTVAALINGSRLVKNPGLERVNCARHREATSDDRG